MWQGKFDENIYSSMRYVSCYCDKHAKVLVGMKAYPFINIAALIGAVLFLASFLPSNIPVFAKLILVGIVGLVSLLPLYMYKTGKSMMLEAGHTDACAQKIGRLVMLHAGTYSPFTIMKKTNEKDTYGKTRSDK